MLNEIQNDEINARKVAELAGVSPSTVSRVYTNAANVSEDVRSRVLAVSEQLGYRPRARSRTAQEQEGLRRVLLFIRSHNRLRLASMLGDFYGYALAGVEQECRRQKLTLTLASDDGVGDLAEQLGELEIQPDTGVLLVGPYTADEVATVQTRALPLVLLNNVVGQMADSVLPDYYGGARLAMTHLLDKGHRQIAFLAGPDRYTTRQRLKGYRDALDEAGLPFEPARVIESSMSIASATEATTALIRSGVAFSALFCVNDISAVGAIQALQTAGRTPGQDVSVIGFDNIDVTDMITLGLTTIHAPKRELGAVAVRRLIDRARDPEATVQRIHLGVRLVERETVHALSG